MAATRETSARTQADSLLLELPPELLLKVFVLASLANAGGCVRMYAFDDFRYGFVREAINLISICRELRPFATEAFHTTHDFKLEVIHDAEGLRGLRDEHCFFRYGQIWIENLERGTYRRTGSQYGMMLPPIHLRQFMRSIELELPVSWGGMTVHRDSLGSTMYAQYDDPTNDWLAPVKKIKDLFEQAKDVTVSFTGSKRGVTQDIADLKMWVDKDMLQVVEVRMMLQAGRMLYCTIEHRRSARIVAGRWWNF